MPHHKTIALIVSALALAACDLDAVDDLSTDTTTGQLFPATGYTKMANDGTILADQTQAWDENGSEAEGTQWSCVRDNETGLYWEVKTNDEGLRDRDWEYTWYDTNPLTNGGDWGIGDTGEGTTTGYETFTGMQSGSDECFDRARCDTEKYIEDVNATQLCGFDDWRLPTGDGEQDGVASAQELQSLLNCQGFSNGNNEEQASSDCEQANAPLIDIDYFPNSNRESLPFLYEVNPDFYWTSTASASARSALSVLFLRGYDTTSTKNSPQFVRLVRANNDG